VGTCAYPIAVRNPQTGQAVEVNALVNTGATFTALPASPLRGLNVVPVRTLGAELANGSIGQLPLGYVEGQINGHSAQVICSFGPEDIQPLLGATTRESLLLAADPVRKRFVSVRAPDVGRQEVP
jgi:predicted aspartyl protease